MHPVYHPPEDPYARYALTCGLLGFCCLPCTPLAILFGLLGRGPQATLGLLLGLFQLLFLCVAGAIVAALVAVSAPPPPS